MPRHPARRHSRDARARAGFTLIELLVVVVIIGVLASIAIPRYALTKGRANIARVKSDLRNLETAQESYFYENSMYSTTVAALKVNTSPGVSITVVAADSTGWSATAVHATTNPVTCAVFYGQAAPVAPATQEGQIACQ
jgi:prepilin-type N-terminal cleavage/methylation domain-containing protein